jgi:hypothetical protein
MERAVIPLRHTPTVLSHIQGVTRFVIYLPALIQAMQKMIVFQDHFQSGLISASSIKPIVSSGLDQMGG